MAVRFLDCFWRRGWRGSACNASITSARLDYKLRCSALESHGGRLFWEALRDEDIVAPRLSSSSTHKRITNAFTSVLWMQHVLLKCLEKFSPSTKKEKHTHSKHFQRTEKACQLARVPRDTRKALDAPVPQRGAQFKKPPFRETPGGLDGHR